MQGGSKNPGRCLGLLPALGRDRLRSQRLGSGTAIGQIPQVNLPTPLLQQQQGAGKEKLDVIGMGSDGQYGFFDHELGLFSVIPAN